MRQYSRCLNTLRTCACPALYHAGDQSFSTISKELSDSEIDGALRQHGIPTDLPLVVQVSRFDKWTDPHGVIEACEIVRRSVDCTLVLVGSKADNDPEPQPYWDRYRL
jgi:trehalose synthase